MSANRDQSAQPNQPVPSSDATITTTTPVEREEVNDRDFMQNREPNSEATVAEPKREEQPERAPKRAVQTSRTAKDVKVGDKVFYHLNPKSNARAWRWVEAEVIDAEPNDTGTPRKLATPLQGTVHLRIHLDPAIDHSSGEFGIRQNVPHGTGMGEWDFDAPDNWERAYEREQDREAERVTIRREEMDRR